jgi:hydrogenase maturation protein HypF
MMIGMTADLVTRRRVTVCGVVQGVGFRPFVHRLATELGLSGFVGNDGSGIFVEVQGDPADVDRFSDRLVAEAPTLAVVEGVEASAVDIVDDAIATAVPTFSIVGSRAEVGATTLMPPDVATCDACLAEVLDPADRRFRYPFANCTDCGPRFTIIRALPYDRPSTSMAGFPMCDGCAAEYADPADRRFHAQPVACPACGPHLSLHLDGDVVEGTDAVVAAIQRVLAEGGTVAVKGIGGYHLACDATGDEPVARLRARKGREAKPFALLVPDLATARRIALVDDAEEEALRSPARPIVLCRRRDDAPVSGLVAPGNPLVGLMLPYSPLHHLFFLPVPGSDVVPPTAVVLTSGNVADERICFEDDDALERLSPLCDAVCTHDRPIEVPCDDSVVRVTDGHAVPVRRSRGFAPLPVRLPVPVVPTVALGGELKATICVASGNYAWISQHIGDLGSLDTEQALEDVQASFCRIYGVEPEVHAVDRHPGYRTHRLSLERGWTGRVEVQHHHAHIASVMAEHGLDGSSPVIGMAFDGTGYGTDPDGAPQIWGGEVLVADYAGFERVGHLAPLPLPGGDGAVRNPCRIAVAYLAALRIATGGSSPSELACDDTERAVVVRMVERGTGCVPTTSMGRLFDAVASLLGIRHRVTYEAQAAIELEAAAACAWPVRPLEFALSADGILDPRPVLEGLLAGLDDGVGVADLACSFHHAVAGAVVASARRAANTAGRVPVALSGGVFQNALLTGLVRRSLEADGFTVLTHRSVPPNDGGLALGQAVVAGYRRS